MQIKRSYLQKYIHDIAIDQIAADYASKGYTIAKAQPLDGYVADMVARKDDETVVVEIKADKMTPEKKRTITGLGNYVNKRPNHKFLVVIATPPKEKKLEIENIEAILEKFLINNFPHELSELSPSARFDEVSDVEIDEMVINEHDIHVKGSGAITITLLFYDGLNQKSRPDHKNRDSFPFDFEVLLDYNGSSELQISEAIKLTVDTSSYFV